MKVIIDIPNEVYDILTEYQVLPENIDLEYFVIHGIPLEDIKVEIEKEKDKHFGTFENDNPIDYGNREMADKVLAIIDKYIKENKQ